jgi:integrase
MRRLLRQLVPVGAPFGLDLSVSAVSEPAPRPVTIVNADLDTVLLLAPAHLRLLILLCHDCALRSGTAVKVGWQHVNDDGEIVIGTKRGAVARVPMSPRLRTAVAACPRGTAPFVSLLRGRLFTHNAAMAAWRALVVSTGLPHGLRLHDLRRTMSEKVYNLTADLRVAQTLLGHGQLKSTLHYLQRPAMSSAAVLDAAILGVTEDA